MPLSFSKHSVHTREGVRVVHVVTPTEHLRVGRARLAELKAGEPGKVDELVVAHAQANAGQEQVFVFRGRDDEGRGSWGFEEGLTDEEKAELGHWLVRAQLPTYTRLIGAGVFALIHADWPLDAVRAYEQGATRLLTELELRSIGEVRGDADEVALDQAHRWILRQVTFFFSVSFDKVLGEVLKQQLPLLEQSVPHLRALVASLPRDSVV